MVAKRALLVGINQYKSISGNNSGLNGCVNDVEDMANTLIMLGFSFNRILIMTDERATKDNILAELQQLVSSTTPGDHLVFYFAGYGSRAIERYSSTGQYTFGAKEVLCPYDIDFGEKRYISNDDIQNIFINYSLPIANAEVILDCGTIGVGRRSEFSTRDDTVNRSLDSNTRYLVPPLDFDFYADYDFFLYVQKFLRASEQHKVFLGPNWLVALWLGCYPGQSCYEIKIDGMMRGLFTYYLCHALRESQLKMKRDTLCGVVSKYMNKKGLNQNALLQTSSETKATALAFNGPIDPFGPP